MIGRVLTSTPRTVGSRPPALAPGRQVTGVALFAVSLLLAGPVLAQPRPPGAGQAPAAVKAKECPPPEGFRAIVHLLDNNAPALQMYPVVGEDPPKNVFKIFGPDMMPRCALERTYDDVQRFKTAYAQLGDVDPKRRLTTTQLLALFNFSYRAFKRYEWCLILQFSKAPEHEYVGFDIPELKEHIEALTKIGIEAARKYVGGMAIYVKGFIGVENDAVHAKKRLDADESRPKPRLPAEIAKDQAKVESYEKRFREFQDLMGSIGRAQQSYRLLSALHGHPRAKWTWPSTGSPAGTLAPLIRQLVDIKKQASK